MSESLKRVLLEAVVVDQKINVKKAKKFDALVEKSRNFLQISFDFSPVWKNKEINKIICQFRGKSGIFDVEVENDVCDVPWELLSESGYVEVCVYAFADGNTVITTGSDSFKVEGGAYKDDAQESDTAATTTIYSKLVEDVELLKTQTAADVETIKTQMAEDLEELKSKTACILTGGRAVQSENGLSIVSESETFMGVSENDDISVAESWSDVTSGIRFTNEGIELKSGNSKILLNGDEISFTAGENGISIGENGTAFVGATPYVGMPEPIVSGVVSGIVGVPEEIEEDENE